MITAAKYLVKKVEEDIVTTADNLFLHTPPYKLGHTSFTKCLLLLTHPYSSILPSIFFTCLSSNHIFTYTRPHIYPNNLPNPNITSLTSSFNSSQLPASNTSTTSSQISFNLNPNSPASFLKHPQDFISILLFFYSLSHPLWLQSISISFSNNAKSKSPQNTGATLSLCHCVTCHHGGQIVYPNGAKTLYIGNQEMSDKSRNRL